MLHSLWLPVLVECFIYFGVWYLAFRPLWVIPQGLSSVSWTYADLIRRDYPIRLIDPVWLANSHDWMVAEFNGLAQVIVQSQRDQSGTIVLTAQAEGVKAGRS